MAKASMSLNEDMDVVLKKSLVDKSFDGWCQLSNLRLQASWVKLLWLMWLKVEVKAETEVEQQGRRFRCQRQLGLILKFETGDIL